MIQEELLPPDPHLMESMRAVGYTLQTAVADVIDNSVTARATQVAIFFGTAPEAYVVLVDNGTGMSRDEARDAMRLAGKSPASSRGANDLGRFGLGLKTASLSQCRDLIVVSKFDGAISGYRWSIDHMLERKSWSLIVLDEESILKLPRISELDNFSTGTLVLWRQLDRLEASIGDLGPAFDEAMLQVRDHLALVFHRFLAGEHGRSFAIAINRNQVQGSDPFLVGSRATQQGPTESFVIDGETVNVQPYTLPHLNRMTPAEKNRAQVAGRIRDSQGFYIYREKRLVIWGTWFRITPKDDLGKLARVRVDIPNTLDYLWSLDIKKSSAAPPPAIRDNLRRIAGRIIEPSKRAFLYRGRPVAVHTRHSPMWSVIDDRGAFRYEINRDHAALKLLSEQLSHPDAGAFSAVLTLLETSFPVEDAYNRLGQDEVHAPRESDQLELVELATALWAVHSSDGGDADVFVDSLSSVDPFVQYPNSRELLRKVTND